MLTSITNYYSTIVSVLILIIFAFLGIIFIIRENTPKLNWAVFYSTLYTTVTLPIINYQCVKTGFWSFTPTNSIDLPFDLYFIWVVLWAIVPTYFLKGRYTIIIAVLLLWMDLLMMPLLEETGVLQLSKGWWIGELLTVLLVFIPGYLWAHCSYNNTYLKYRTLCQIIVMTAVIVIGIPYILQLYGLAPILDHQLNPFNLQFLIMISLPALTAVFDLVKRGKGTPFPYDKTERIVTNGVYGYIRNPIQWSFTWMFVPLSIYYETYFLLIGSVVSIAYAYGISDIQEYEDMEERFGEEWISYKQQTPKWRFLWRPNTYANGTIYFDSNCHQCSQLSQWFEQQKTTSLSIDKASNFPRPTILQATYIDNYGNEYRSVEAIACALEHINLGYASLGWFMRFPGINYLLQSIVDVLPPTRECEI